MAKVTIVIEDIEGGKVRCVSTPMAKEMIQLTQHDAGLTNAQAYALSAMRHIITIAGRPHESQKKAVKLWTPRGGLFE